MPSFCAVLNCSNSAARTVGISYFRYVQNAKGNKLTVFQIKIPGVLQRCSDRDRELQRQRREKWIQALQRADLTATKIKYGRICSNHFHTGKPAALKDINNPDWAPLQMGYYTPARLGDQKKTEYKRKLQTAGDPVIENHGNVTTITLSNNPLSLEDDEHRRILNTENDVSYLRKEAETLRLQLEFRNNELQELQTELSLIKADFEKSQNLIKTFCKR